MDSLDGEPSTPWKSISELAEQHMRSRLHIYYESERRLGENSPSLTSLAADETIRALEAADDKELAIREAADGLGPLVFQHVLKSPKASYCLLRAFANFHVGEGRQAIDLDEAIIRNERYVRSRDNNDGKYLVRLEDLATVLSDKPKEGKTVVFVRKDPPKGGLEVLDDLRKRIMRILPSSTSFSQTFDRITNGILRGLDWTNVLVAGGMALTTMLHTDTTEENRAMIQHPEIDMYVYGLGPRDANRKAEEIHDTWAANLPAGIERRVVKDAKSITLIPSHPHRRIQIILKLSRCPTDVLLNLDLDPCALGFDGSSVFMLPRCARAIETGYSTFTTDIAYGRHINTIRAPTETRLFQHADLGFGLRFLPSYMRFLEEGQCTKQDAIAWTSKVTGMRPCAEQQRDRYPSGPEPGLKTMNRIAYLANDHVRRLYWGPTPLTIFRESKHLNWRIVSEDRAVTRIFEWNNEEQWRECVNEAREDFARLIAHNIDLRDSGKPLLGPKIVGKDLGGTVANSVGCLENFEMFSRYCEAWRKDARREACFKDQLPIFFRPQWDEKSMNAAIPMSQEYYAFEDGSRFNEYATKAYELKNCDDLATYDWYEEYDHAELETDIDRANDRLFELLKDTITNKLGVSQRPTSDYRGYLTRRIRRQVFGPSFRSVAERQIVLPLLMTNELERYLKSLLEQDSASYPHAAAIFSPIIPVHNPATHDPNGSRLPSLRDDADVIGNLRYWVISNEGMWAGQHRVLDELAETLWSLYHLYYRFGDTVPSDPSVGCRYLQRWRKKRSRQFQDEDHREMMLFREWALPTAQPPSFGGSSVTERFNPHTHPLFDADAVQYPFPDDLFWKDGDEGDRDQAVDGVPGWRTAPAQDLTCNTPAEEFFNPKGLLPPRPGEQERGQKEEVPFSCVRLFQIN